MQTATLPDTGVSVTDSRIRVRSAHTRFYIALTIFMAGVVVVGFWPSFFARLLRGDVARPALIQLHALVFLGWMGLLAVQVVAAARGNMRLHRRLGKWGIVYGCLVLAAGLAVGVIAPVLHVAAGEWSQDRAAGFLLTTLGDMTLFAVFFGAAVAYRSRPQIHKRLMITATVGLLFAAVGRMHFITSMPLAILLWLSPLFAGMIRDWIVEHRVHPAYVVGAIGLFAGSLRELVIQSEGWLRIGRPLLELLR